MTVRILQGDVRDKLAELDDASVHCIIVDPPYGQTDLPWDRRIGGWPELLKRVLAPEGSMWCFGSLRFFLECRHEFSAWRVVQDIVWEKHNGSSLHADRFRRVHELIVQFVPVGRPWSTVFKSPVYTNDAVARTVRRKTKPAHWHGIGQGYYRSEDGGHRLARSVFYARSEHGRAEHPTQKPIAAILPLIEYSCPPAGLVLDPFAGSGSVGCAAQQLGRDCILIELNPDYAGMARRRIERDAGLFADLAERAHG